MLLRRALLDDVRDAQPERASPMPAIFMPEHDWRDARVPSSLLAIRAMMT